MPKITSYAALETFGRKRLSRSFFMREFLYSEIAAFHGIPNIPDAPELAIAAGRRLCEELLEPLQSTFGRIAIRSAYRSEAVNGFGQANGLNCASNASNYAAHIWDRRDAEGRMGAMACIVVPWFADRYEAGGDWRELAWWIHDHLPYSTLCFYPGRAAFNIGWREEPERSIYSHVAPKGYLTRAGMENHGGDHRSSYPEFPTLVR